MTSAGEHPDPRPVLQMRGISKRYPGARALDGASLDVRAGEVHIVLGENGAGKSTLMKILSGAVRADAGEILLDGRAVDFNSPLRARRLGISTIYQELSLVPHLSVAENIFLGKTPTYWGGVVDWRRMRAGARRILDGLGVSIDCDAPVHSLRLAQQQMVEVARALSDDARILVMDEPTSALSRREVDELFSTIARLTASGVAVVYISHRMDEVFRIGHRVTVLRDGCHVATLPIAGTTVPELVRLMADREVAEHYPRRERRHREHDASERVSEPREPPSRCALRRPSRSGAVGERLPAVASAEAGVGESEGRSPSEEEGEEVLRVDRLHGAGLEDISFVLRRGEILGIAGLAGAGRTRLARALVGADRIPERRIAVRGIPVRIESPADAARAGIGFLPEDRKQQGLVLRLSVERNISLSHLTAIARAGVVDRAKERGEARDAIAGLRIRTPGPDELVLNLSGGNQQKVVLAKWLAAHAAILIFDEPTRGIDVAARQEIYLLMNRLVENGAGLIMISSDLPEVLGMSDRILVMRGGRIAVELDAREANDATVLQSALGVAS